MKNLSSKNKFVSVIVLFIVLSVLSYKGAIKKTLALKTTANSLSVEERTYQNGKIPFVQLEKQLATLDSLIGYYEYDYENIDEILFNELSRYCSASGLLITKLPSSHYSIESNFRFVTNKVEISGRYKDIVLLIYELENSLSKVGRIISVNFTKIEKYNEPVSLIAEIYLQNIIINKP